MSLFKFENILGTLVLAKDVNDDMVVETMVLDLKHNCITITGYEFDAEGTRYHVEYNVSIVDLSDESEQNSGQPIVTKI